MNLTVRGLAASRGDGPLFEDVDFDLSAGQAMVVTGPNGVGKSTLLRVVAGLLPAAAGTVVLAGAGGAGHRRERMHYLGHRNAMKRELTAGENLAFWKAFMGHGEAETAGGRGDAGGPGGAYATTVAEAAATVGLADLLHLPFGYLSAGQQRRLAMAKLLVSHRPVWLLDEPTAALDSASESLFARLVGDHLGCGGIVIAATHQPLGLTAPQRLALRPLRHAAAPSAYLEEGW